MVTPVNKIKVLHITYWYPNRRNKLEALFIKNHVNSLLPRVEHQYLYHFQVSYSDRFYLNTRRVSQNQSVFQLLGPIPWWLVEILSFMGMSFLLFVKAKKYDVVNIHIAYPLLTYFHLLKKWIKKPIVITEHWSGYHFNFGVKKALPRAKRIFKHDLPCIAVSQSLLMDIRKFSGVALSKSIVLPNVVDVKVFNRHPYPTDVKTFFMVSNWKWPKRPEVIINAFFDFIQTDEYSNYKLRIGGAGVQLEEMKKLIESLKINASVTILGPLRPEVIAREMNECTAFLHCSEYETFSVVCAEALSCGVPVVASEVGGIPEFVDIKNGILVKNNAVQEWHLALRKFAQSHFDCSKISAEAQKKFSMEGVGLRYSNFLKEICETYE